MRESGDAAMGAFDVFSGQSPESGIGDAIDDRAKIRESGASFREEPSADPRGFA